MPSLKYLVCALLVGGLTSMSNSTVRAQSAPEQPSASKQLLRSVQNTLPPTVTVMQANNGQLVNTSSELDRLGQVLGIPSWDCRHVIDLMIKNRWRRNMGIHDFAGNSLVMVPPVLVPLTPGDLNLQSVHLAANQDATQGSVFQLTIHNNSQVPVGNFRVTLVAVLGTIQVHSPCVTTCIHHIDAGAVATVEMQLPACAFDTLVAAVDSLDELLECDELNNVHILSRSSISVQPCATIETVATGTTTTSIGSGHPVATPSPSDPSETAPDSVPGLPNPGLQNPGTGPLEKPDVEGIDVDKLVLEELESSARLFRK